MKIVKWRAIISLLLFITFIIVLLTGIGLYIAPPGWFVKSNGWKFLGLGKTPLEMLHTYVGFAMSGLIVIHIVLNFKLWLNEWKTLFK